MFNVAIIGVDGAKNYSTFKQKCIYFLREKAKDGITIFTTEENEYISRFASEYRINVQVFQTDWYTYGKDALKARNQRLLKECNGVISFEDGRAETNFIKSLAKSIGIPVKRVTI